MNGSNGSPGIAPIGIGFWVANAGVDAALAADLYVGAAAVGLSFGGGLLIGAGLTIAAIGIADVLNQC